MFLSDFLKNKINQGRWCNGAMLLFYLKINLWSENDCREIGVVLNRTSQILVSASARNKGIFSVGLAN